MTTVCIYLGLLRSSDVEENPGPRASHRSYRVVYANIRSLHRNLSIFFLSLIARGRGVFSETLVSSIPRIGELMVPGFG